MGKKTERQRQEQLGMVTISREKMAQIEQDFTSFGLCLSALVNRHGVVSEEGVVEYQLGLDDFVAISEADIKIENEMTDEVPSTMVRLFKKKQNGGVAQSGQAEEENS